MAMTGFYAIQNSEIRFGRDGNWYADGERIANPRIAALFSRSVEPCSGGGYRLRVGDETAPIIVDDTPYVVVGVDIAAAIRVTLNDGTQEQVAAESLALSDDNVFYITVKGGAATARLLRQAHYQIASHVAEAGDGSFVLRVGGREYPIRRR